MLNALLKHIREQKDCTLAIDILTEAYTRCVEPLKHSHPQLYHTIANELYVECYGEHFSEWLAVKATRSMKNADGTEGEHWTINQIDDFIRQYSIKCENFNRWDLYYIMNMLYSDYYSVFGTDTSTYVKMSKAWFADIDVAEGKAYRYYMSMKKQ